MAWHNSSTRGPRMIRMPKILHALLMLLLVGVSTYAIKVDKLDFHHVDLPIVRSNLTFLERVQILVKHGEARFKLFSHMVNKRPHAFGMELNGYVSSVQHLAANGPYFISLAVGTPPRPLNFTLDVLLSLTMVQCQTNQNTIEEHDGVVFYPQHSRSYRPVQCGEFSCHSYIAKESLCPPESGKCVYSNVTHGNLQNLEGHVARDTFLVSGVFGDVTFRCDETRWGINHVSGMLALARGSMSFVSQLGFSNFSYCLRELSKADRQPSHFCIDCPLQAQNQKTPMYLQLASHTNSKSSTHFSNFYNIKVRKVFVKNKATQVNTSRALILSPNGDGSVLLDSGMTFSYFPRLAYDRIVEAIRKSVPFIPPAQVRGFEVCYKLDPLSADPLPNLIFQVHRWTESGSYHPNQDIIIPSENVFIKNLGDAHDIACLALKSTTAKYSLLGTFLFQGFGISLDKDGYKMTIIPDQC